MQTVFNRTYTNQSLPNHTYTVPGEMRTDDMQTVFNRTYTNQSLPNHTYTVPGEMRTDDMQSVLTHTWTNQSIYTHSASNEVCTPNLTFLSNQANASTEGQTIYDIHSLFNHTYSNKHDDDCMDSTQFFSVTHDCMKHFVSVVDPSCSVDLCCTYNKECNAAQSTEIISTEVISVPVDHSISYSEATSQHDTASLNDNSEFIRQPSGEIYQRPRSSQHMYSIHNVSMNVTIQSNHTTCTDSASNEVCTPNLTFLSNQANASTGEEAMNMHSLLNHTYPYTNSETQTTQLQSLPNHTYTVPGEMRTADMQTVLNHTYTNQSLPNHTYTVPGEMRTDDMQSMLTRTYTNQSLPNHAYIVSGEMRTADMQTVLNHTYTNQSLPNHTYTVPGEMRTDDMQSVLNHTCTNLSDNHRTNENPIWYHTPIIDASENLNMNDTNTISLINNTPTILREHLNMNATLDNIANIDVACYITCSTQPFQSNTHINSYTKLSQQYQNYIEMIPKFSCKSCERIMYRDQLYLSSIVQESIGITCTNDLVCITCKRSLHKKNIPTLAVRDNNLHVESIPHQLQNLNLLEKRLISKVNTFFTLVLLPGYPVGQFGEKGHVIYFPVDTCSISNQLWNEDQARNRFMVVACSCRNRLTPPKFIRPMKVYQALSWLKRNNPLYEDLQLPIEDTVRSSSTACDAGNIDLTEMSFIPTNYSSDFTIINLNAENPIDLHTVDSSEEMAFPWLLPTGAHGFNAMRPRTLTLNQYYKSRLLNIVFTSLFPYMSIVTLTSDLQNQ